MLTDDDDDRERTTIASESLVVYSLSCQMNSTEFNRNELEKKAPANSRKYQFFVHVSVYVLQLPCGVSSFNLCMNMTYGKLMISQWFEHLQQKLIIHYS